MLPSTTYLKGGDGDEDEKLSVLNPRGAVSRIDKTRDKMSFLDLPVEIRCEIYSHLLVSTEPLQISVGDEKPVVLEQFRVCDSHDWLKHPRGPKPLPIHGYPILCLSRLIHDEATEILYSKNTFSLNIRPLLFLSVIGQRNRDLIRRLKASWQPEGTHITGFRKLAGLLAGMKSLREVQYALHHRSYHPSMIPMVQYIESLGMSWAVEERDNMGVEYPLLPLPPKVVKGKPWDGKVRIVLQTLFTEEMEIVKRQNTELFLEQVKQNQGFCDLDQEWATSDFESPDSGRTSSRFNFALLPRSIRDRVYSHVIPTYCCISLQIFVDSFISTHEYADGIRPSVPLTFSSIRTPPPPRKLFLEPLKIKLGYKTFYSLLFVSRCISQEVTEFIFSMSKIEICAQSLRIFDMLGHHAICSIRELYLLHTLKEQSIPVVHRGGVWECSWYRLPYQPQEHGWNGGRRLQSILERLAEAGNLQSVTFFLVLHYDGSDRPRGLNRMLRIQTGYSQVLNAIRRLKESSHWRSNIVVKVLAVEEAFYGPFFKYNDAVDVTHALNL